MRYSALFPKTKKEAPKDEVSVNAKLLIRAGFIEKLAAGVYNFLPLGWKVHEKIGQIIREEMDLIGGQEINLAALHPKSIWETSGRWDKFGALYKLKSQSGDDLALGATHEEVLTPIIAQHVSSYKDLPLYLYQIQVKFRDEPRAKSGILRCREFVMKDLYSFHATEEDRASYYERVRKAYEKIFKRFGLKAIYTKASGGSFSEFSHEFQVITPAGEDEIIYCPEGDFSENVDITKVKEGKECDMGHGPLKRAKVIEVGNIFPLGTKYSKDQKVFYTDKDGSQKEIWFASYGIGPTRVMGALVEVHHDDKGIIWPKTVAPFQAHLLVVSSQKSVVRTADDIYTKLEASGVEVLYDDRDVSAGEKFATADLLGIPHRLVMSEKTGDKIEFKKRNEDKTELLQFDELIKRLKEETEG